MNDTDCAMCSMPLKTVNDRKSHLWDMMVGCDEIASELEHDMDKNENVISQIYALKECLSQLRQIEKE